MNAKYLCRKYRLNKETQFNLDYLHLKSILLNINYTTVITLIDFNQYISNKQCLTFTENNSFEICFKLLNELKSLSNVNNTVIVLLCEYLLKNFTDKLSDVQVKDVKILELTSKLFILLLQEHIKQFDTYKRHYEQPLVIIEQLLMNSKIDTCSKVIRLCRELLPQISVNYISEMNYLLVKYAKKALEFRNYSTAPTQSNNILTSFSSNQVDEDPTNKRKSPSFKDHMLKKTNPMAARMSIDITSTSPSLSSSLKTRGSIDITGTSPLLSSSLKSKSTYLTPPNTTGPTSNFHSYFIMPLVPPTKDQWVKDDTVSECMACNNVSFTLMNRRHHCRRCGRVVCSSCSQYLTMINETLQRTCSDCFKQSELLSLNDNKRRTPVDDKNLDLSRRLQKSMKMNSRRKASQLIETKTGEQQAYWELGNDLDDDQETRERFRYQQAPSTSLCLSILDLHDDSLECGKELLQMCDQLSSFLQTANNNQKKTEDFALILNMIKYLLCNAKIKLLQNSSTTIISLCDTYLSLIDILEELLIANCSNIPSLNDLRNQETTRRLRNRLLEEERHDLAMNLSTKCGLDSQTVWASWGLIELKRGSYKDARTKFEKCLKSATNKHQSITQSQLKILNDIISYFEQAPPIRLTGVSRSNIF
jgi:zinc finger FYVE domain-containing protein 26